MSLVALTAGIKLFQETQRPASAALGRVAEGWFKDPLTKSAALAIALAAIGAKTMETLDKFQKSQEGLQNFSNYQFSSYRFSNPGKDIVLGVEKAMAIPLAATDFTPNLTQAIQLISTGGEESISQVFFYGSGLLSQQKTVLRIPWEMFEELPAAFQVPPDQRQEIDNFLQRDAIFDEPLTDTDVDFLPDEPIPNFKLTLPGSI